MTAAQHKTRPAFVPCQVPGCATRAKSICDWPVERRGEHVPCGRPICEQHREEMGDGVKLCPVHAKIAHVTLAEMLDEARAELGKRKALYPRWVERGKLSQERADRGLLRQAAIVAHLVRMVPPPRSPQAALPFLAKTTGETHAG